MKEGGDYISNEERSYFCEPFLEFSNDEVFVDCGYYDGLSTKAFAKRTNNLYDKIVAFEPDEKMYMEALGETRGMPRFEIFNKGCWSKEAKFSFKQKPGGSSFIEESGDGTVEVTTIDSVLRGSKATYIKMDIEGSELEALKEAEVTIRKWKPKLAICVYQKPMDIVEIPKYIMGLNLDYEYYIRQYDSWCTGVVFYAIPK